MSKQNTRKKVSYLYATLGIALVLFLIGFFGTMLLYAHQNLELSQDKIPVIVEIKETADSAALIALPLWLKKQPFLKEETLRLVRKEEKLKEFMAEYGNDEAIDATLIPFPDSYEFRLAPEWLGKNKTATMKTEIKKNSAVQEVVSDVDMAREAANNAQSLTIVAFMLAILFVIVAVTLIHNTIRLALYADRFLIKNMELVGASWEFIARPYLLRSLKNACWSVFLALLALFGLLWWLQSYLLEVNLLFMSPIFWLFLVALLGLGVLISWVSTYYVVNKYLKMRLDDLY